MFQVCLRARDDGSRPLRGGPAAIALLGVVAGLLTGCGRSQATDTASLAGRVTIDGEPVVTGGIQFMPLDQGRPAFAEVRDGVYRADVPRGRVRAIFSSRRETGRQIEIYSTTVPEVVDVLPASLREGIEITVSGDDAAHDFNLTSRKGEQP